MELRPYFLAGDVLANATAGACAGALASLLVSDSLGMLGGMLAGMLLGMAVAFVVSFLFMPWFGAHEVMLPVMLGGMVAGMVMGMAEQVEATEVPRVALSGAGLGLLSWAACWLLDGWLAGRRAKWTS